MPILLLPLILAFTTIADDQASEARKTATHAVQRTESATFDPDRPPRWWLDKMQRPCAKVADRAAC